MGELKHTDIAIRGRVFPTIEAAAAAHGVSYNAVLIALRKGTLDRVGTRRTGVEPMPVMIRGRRFADAYAAARHFGVSPQTVWRAIRLGRTDRIGLGQKYNGARSKPITLGGVRFASMTDASEALGRDRSYVVHVLRRGGPRAREGLIGAAMRLEAAGRAAG